MPLNFNYKHRHIDEPIVSNVLGNYCAMPVSSKVLEDLLHVVFNIMCCSPVKPLYNKTVDVLESLGFKVEQDFHYVNVEYTGNKIHHKIGETSLDIYKKYINSVIKLLKTYTNVDMVKFNKITNGFSIECRVCHIIDQNCANYEHVHNFVSYEDLFNLQP